MTRKRPILLPGKELYSIHYDALATGRLSEDLKRRELTPLFKVAKARLWVSETEGNELLKAILDGKPEAAWRVCQPWIAALNAKEEQDGQAIASWLALYNIIKYNNLLRSLRPPYHLLRGNHIGITKQNLVRAIEVETLEKKNKGECSRHFMGLVICTLCSSLPEWAKKEDGTMGYAWLSLRKELYGKEYYTEEANKDSQDPWILSPSHGYFKSGRWFLPAVENLEAKIKELYKIFPLNKYYELEQLRTKLDL